MVVYTQNEKYTIWADTSTYLYHIQMAGEEVGTKPYRTAAEAMEEASR